MAKRRITCLILALCLLASSLSLTVFADTGLSISSDAVELLKKEEGFSKKPYWDYAQWTVGYGTKCPDDKLEEYKKNGIPEPEAEKLLRDYIARFESEINKFATKTGTNLNQNQFDALMLFSYNCGTAWMYSTTGILYKAVVGGATGNELINAFSRWCNAGGQIKTFLLRRRLSEANIYLNGIYNQLPPENYAYTLFDAAGGKTSPNVQGYDTNLTAKIIPTATYSGYTFKGWYTAQTGGIKVTKLDASTKNVRLYARWTDGTENDTPQEPEKGVTVTVNTDGLNVRQGPGTNYQSIQKVNKGTKLVITETAKGGSYTWGKCNLGWVCLQYTDYDAITAPQPEAPAVIQTGTVKVEGGGQLRIRSGPSTGYSVVGYLNTGDKVCITEVKTAGTMQWGKIDKGWISMNYVVLDKPDGEKPTEPETQPETKPEAQPETQPETQPQETTKQTGTVKVSDSLNIRSGPGTNYKIVGYLTNGAKVTITETAKNGSATWGKTEKGWISLSYVVMDQAQQTPEVKPVKGTVKVTDTLRIRKGPGTSYAIAGYLNNGAKVEILEQKTVNGTKWGRISKGWISLSYVVLTTDTAKPQTTTKTVTADCLRIRSAAGTGNKIVGYLYKNEKVTILETKKVGTTTWGRVSKGWISMAYVK